MLSPGPATKIYLATGVTDMRKSFNGLHALVAATLAAVKKTPKRSFFSCMYPFYGYLKIP